MITDLPFWNSFPSLIQSMQVTCPRRKLVHWSTRNANGNTLQQMGPEEHTIGNGEYVLGGVYGIDGDVVHYISSGIPYHRWLVKWFFGRMV